MIQQAGQADMALEDSPFFVVLRRSSPTLLCMSSMQLLLHIWLLQSQNVVTSSVIASITASDFFRCLPLLAPEDDFKFPAASAQIHLPAAALWMGGLPCTKPCVSSGWPPSPWTCCRSVLSPVQAPPPPPPPLPPLLHGAVHCQRVIWCHREGISPALATISNAAQLP